MKEYKAGSSYYPFLDDAEEIYYTDDFISFHKENGEELSVDDLEIWAMWLNSPWSLANEGYHITFNTDNTYSQIEKGRPIWRCEYYVVGYECTSASVFGYGDTEISAFENCKANFRMLQTKYNPEDVNF